MGVRMDQSTTRGKVQGWKLARELGEPPEGGDTHPPTLNPRGGRESAGKKRTGLQADTRRDLLPSGYLVWV